jgi:hypothetical protein
MSEQFNHPDAEKAQVIADSKFAEAKKLPPGPEQRKLLKEAGSYDVLAKVKGWLSGELRPPD